MGHASTRTQPNSESANSAKAEYQDALEFAQRAHTGQKRKQTGEDFVEHPIAVAQLLAGAGFHGEVVIAAYLHDSVEKGPVSLEDVRSGFGERVADVIAALTEDPSLDGYAERKRALRRQVLAAGGGSVMIYAADRVANMRDWCHVAPEQRTAVADRLGTTLAERLELWAEDLEELTAHDPELPFLGEIELDLRKLRAESRSAAAT